MKSFVKNIGLTIFLMFFGGLSICLGQDAPNNLVLKKGKIISKENSANSAGEVEIIQYRLEQVKLTKPLEIQEGEPPLESAFRIVIVTAKPLPFNDYSIWIDDNQKDAYQIKPNAVAILIYARTLPNGTIKLALSKRSERNPESRLVLPGTLYVPSEYATSQTEIGANLPRIQLRRLSARFSRIEIRIENSGGRCSALAYSNIPLALEIDGRDFMIGCDGDDVVVSGFSIEDFAQLRDGAEIALKFGYGRSARDRRVVGRLNKNLVQQ